MYICIYMYILGLGLLALRNAGRLARTNVLRGHYSGEVLGPLCWETLLLHPWREMTL